MMITIGRGMSGVATFVAAGLFASAAPAQSFTPEMQELIEAARQEGEVRVVSGAGNLGGAEGFRRAQEDIKRKYGIDLAVRYTPGGTMPGIANEIAMRVSNGLPSDTDLYIGPSSTIFGLRDQELFLAAPWQSYDPERITDEVVDLDGTQVKVLSLTAGFTYNRELAPSEPKSLQDFLSPAWKGKIGTTPYAASFDVIGTSLLMGKEGALDYARQLSEQIAGFVRCVEMERVVSGEFVALVTDCGGQDSRRLIDQGAPLVRVVPPELAYVSHQYLSVPKNAVNPNAGKLLVVYFLSEEGQNMLWELWQTDLDLLPGSNMASEIAALEAQHGKEFVRLGINFAASNPEGIEVQNEVARLLRESSP